MEGDSRFQVILFETGAVDDDVQSWKNASTLIKARLEQGINVVAVLVREPTTQAFFELLHLTVWPELSERVQEVLGEYRKLAKNVLSDGNAEYPAKATIESQLAALGDMFSDKNLGDITPLKFSNQCDLIHTTVATEYFKKQPFHFQYVDTYSFLKPDDFKVVSSIADARFKDQFLRIKEAREPTCFLMHGTYSVEADSVSPVSVEVLAALMACKLRCPAMEIVQPRMGPFMLDPDVVVATSARLVRRLSHREALELRSRSQGWEVSPVLIKLLQDANIPLTYIWSKKPFDVRLDIVSRSATPASEGPQPLLICHKDDLAVVIVEKLSDSKDASFTSTVFGFFDRHKVDPLLISNTATSIAVTVELVPNAMVDPMVAFNRLLKDLRGNYRVTVIEKCTAVTLVGRQLSGVMYQLGPALELMKTHKIHQAMLSESNFTLTYVVDSGVSRKLIGRLYDAVFKDTPVDTQVFGLSVEEYRPLLRPWRVHDVELRFSKPQPLVWEDNAAKAATESKPQEVSWWRTRRAELVELATQQSPVFAYNVQSFRDAIHALRKEVTAVDRVFYAIKANPHPDILRLFFEENVGFECVSIGELQHVLGLFPGMPGSRILFTPNFVARHEYEAAFRAGANVTVDNVHPLRHWPDTFKGREVFLRIDPGRGEGHHKHVRTGGKSSKFGISQTDAALVAELVKQAGATVVGLHAHLGSGNLTPELWGETAAQLSSLFSHFPHVRALDLGGGLGVKYREDDSPLDLSEVNNLISSWRSSSPHKVELWLEPGRFLVARAGVLLAKVTQLKTKEGTTFVGIDAGFNSLVRPTMYDSYHHIVNLSRLDEPAAITAEVVGPICESGDVLGHNRKLPATQEGDVVLVDTAGAYGRSMSSNYNMRLPAIEVFLS
eukprot:TRINITY_DN1873_c0_g1_i2.p1 TRINITY_DN1873_c0_g1~~TRINITY_DN1873_c0_g1_i2.p1  ORF type:complete len:893 (+),score=290.11 TRINITY_DN1873_c0_g1_i2:119-2797(+)